MTAPQEKRVSETKSHNNAPGREFVPLDVAVQNEKSVVVVKWADGHTSTIPIKRLRGFCPCAVCQGHEVSVLKYVDNKVAAIFDAEAVGRYAINFKFGDAHDTGIFRWDMLRKLDPAEEERWGPPEKIR
jgi:DUF971 family protein